MPMLRSRFRLASFIYNRRVRGWLIQLLLLIAIAALLWFFVGNALDNIAKRNLTTGFGFLWNTAGFGIDDSLIPWSPTDSYGRALLVGVLNTLLVSAFGIVLATALGSILALMRISRNGLASNVARAFVEFIRNTPELLLIIFWYFALLQPLPPPRKSLQIFDSIFLNVRGLYLPSPVFSDGGAAWRWGFLLGIGVTVALALLRRRLSTFWTFFGSVVALVALPLLAIAVRRVSVDWDTPALRGLNFVGGMHLSPEFIALVLGVMIYSSAFIAEIIRSGILGVDRGQIEAARSLGLRYLPTMRLVIVPQALRIIIPPLIGQYLSLIKGTSLAVAIAYPDIVQIFAGVVLNQTGQAIEIMMITMMIYLLFSLTISFLMNLYNRRITSIEN